MPPGTDETAAPARATGASPKAALVALLADVLRRRALPQAQAARRCRTDPATLAQVLRGRLERVSLDRLFSWLAALGCGVEIRVAPDPGDAGGITVRRASALAAGDGDGERTEAARQESEDRYRTLLETAPDAVHVHRDGIIILANREAAVLFGAASPAELVGREALALVDPASLPLAQARTARLAAPGQRNPLTELTLRRLDGQRVVAEAASAAIRLDGKLAVQAVLRDVTARRRAEAALRESEDRYRATQEHAGIGIGEVDADGRFLRVNAALGAITGYTKDELLQRTVFAITHPEDAQAERADYARLVAGAIASYAREKRYRRPDGAERWVEVAASAVRDPAGRFLHGVRVVQDVTERKLAEARQRRLLGELNHRVKNTLAVVQALARQTAAQAGASGEAFARPFLGRLRALAAAHELLTEAGWAGVRLAALVRRVLAPHAGPERVVVAVGEALLPAALMQDLALVLHELATNALMHGALAQPDGRVTVEGGVLDGADGDVLRLVWRETGGRPVEPSGRRGFGTALITQTLAHAHGGTVELDWRREGLVCRLRVPLGPAAEGPPA